MKDATFYKAQTILAQLGGNKFRAMTGANGFLFGSDDQPTLEFYFCGCRKTNHVTIHLHKSSDTYRMTFLHIPASAAKPLKEIKVVDDVYAEDLQRIFTETTGLYTSL